MAVLDSIPGISVTVKVGDKALKEYDPPDDDGQEDLPDKTVLKYIEVPSDTLYVVEVAIEPKCPLNCETLSARLTVDGKYIWGSFFKGVKHAKYTQLKVIKGKYMSLLNGDWVLKKLKFGTIKTEFSDVNSRIEKDQKALAGVGDIRIEIHRRGYLSSIHSKVGEGFHGPPSLIAEKATIKNGLSHGTFFQSEDTKKPNCKTATYLDGKANPMAVFAFKYRSRASLLKMGIIDPLDGLNEKEIRELARLQKRTQLEESEAKNHVADHRQTTKRKSPDENDVNTEVDLTGKGAVVRTTAKKRKTADSNQTIYLD